MMGGKWANTKSGKRIARKLQQKYANRLPHQAYADKIEDWMICRDLQLENVYYIGMGQLRGQQLYGR